MKRLLQFRHTKKSLWFLLLGTVALSYVNFSSLLNPQGELFSYAYNSERVKLKVAEFQSILNKLEKEIQYHFDYTIHNIKKGREQNPLASLFNLPEKAPFTILLYNGNRLVKWYGDNVNNDRDILYRAAQHRYIKINNTLYTTSATRYKRYTLIGLVPIAESYEYENEHLKNRFAPIFQGYDNFTLGPVGYRIFNHREEYVFCLQLNPEEPKPMDLFVLVIIAIQLLLYAGTLFLFYRLFQIYSCQKWALLLNIVMPILALGFRIIVYLNTLGSVFYDYSEGIVMVVLLNVFFDFLLIFFVQKIQQHTLKNYDLGAYSRAAKYWSLALNLLISVIVISYVFSVLEYFILKQEVIEPFRNIYSLSATSVLVFCFIVLVSMLYSSMLYITFKYFRPHLPLRQLLLFQFGMSLLYVLYAFDKTIFLPSLIFLVVLQVQTMLFTQPKTISRFYQILIVMIELTVFFTLFTQFLFSSRSHNIQLELLKELTVETDPIVENRLVEISEEIQQDGELEGIIARSADSFTIPRYLYRRYFNSIRDRYDVQITCCFQDEELHLIDADRVTTCFDYFGTKLNSSEAKTVEGSNFRFLDNYNGRVSYHGQFFYQVGRSLFGVFIDIDSKQSVSSTGYPELLKAYRSDIEQKLKNYSYAKYYKGVLVEQNGNMKYENYLAYYEPENIQNFKTFNKEGVAHMAYRNKDFVVIISSQSPIVINFIIELSYVFILVLLLTLVYNNRHLKVRHSVRSNLQYKIIFSVSGTIILTLLILISFVVNGLIGQLQHDQAQEFTRNILKASFFVKEDLTSGDYSNMSIEDKLVSLSNVIQSDINIYNANGDLVFSSRPEIREKGFIGSKVNSLALYHLVDKKKTTYIAHEDISKLGFESTYSTILNDQNRIIYIIQIPNFTSREELEKSISQIIGIGINSLLLIALISIFLIFVIFRRVLKPLGEIKTELSTIAFDKSFSKINYKYDDEIGGLVSEYNKKIEELKKNTKLLTESERQHAWRSVSRQVAHEIKNPLTPMKLSIQFLQKAYSQQNDNFERIFNKSTHSLIEHIDTLSAIANSFSSFAKLPSLVLQEMDVIGCLESSMVLFEKEKDVQLKRNYSDEEKIMVNADPAQLQRCFNNIIKNAIQAVEQETALIEVFVMQEIEKVVIGIKDNGKGITEEEQEKIFTPNFTTKSSGMGIGLTIVKNIVEKSGGRIWFNTQKKLGTTFFIQLPLLKVTTDA